MMTPLNLPSFEHRISGEGDKMFIFDPIRKKNVALTPEEWVRQNFLRYLAEVKEYPVSRIAVEYSLVLNGLSKRCDILYFNAAGAPALLIECKAPDVPIRQETFDQITTYNMKLKVPFMILTNGLLHYSFQINTNGAGYQFLTEIPEPLFIEKT